MLHVPRTSAGRSVATLVVAALTVVALAPRPAAADGVPNAVGAHGAALDFGPEADAEVPPVVDGAPTPTGVGYWLVTGAGAVLAFGDADDHGSPADGDLEAPVVGIASTADGDGYWVASTRGEVLAFGAATPHGAADALDLDAPVVAIAPTPSGSGYWLATGAGEVLAFGDAPFLGAAADDAFAERVVDLAATKSGDGYWLLARDGTLAAFGAANPVPAPEQTEPDDDDPAAALAVDAGGEGLWIARASGAVDARGAAHHGPGGDPVPGVDAPVVAVVAHPHGGYWTIRGDEPGAPASPAVGDAGPAPVATDGPVDPDHPFLVCTRRIESGGDYGAVNPTGTYRGAYQFHRNTWDETARQAGRADLVGVDPAAAAPADQDALALALYERQGARPWLGRCAGL